MRQLAKLGVRAGLYDFGGGIGALRCVERPYLTFAVRTHEFTRPERIATIRRNLAGVLGHPAAESFVFTTPPEALRILGYTDG